MKTRKHILPLGGLAALALATSAHAGQIFLDDFSGGAGADLHGTTPDVTTGGATWVATSNYKADGSFTLAGAATMTLAFTPVDGRVYTLDAQIENLGGSQWAQFGFGGSQTTDAIWTTRPWMLLRVAGDATNNHAVSAGSGTGTAGLSNWSSLGTLRYADDLDVRIVLDTTGGTDNWTATWYAKAGNAGSYTEVRSAVTLTGDQDDITSVGFSTYNVANEGTLNSFSLSDDTGGTFPLAITPNATTAGNYDFEWDSQEDKLYDLVSDTSLATAPGSWDVYDPDGPGGDPPYGDIASGGTTTSRMNVPGGGDSKRFFAVIEKTP